MPESSLYTSIPRKKWSGPKTLSVNCLLSSGINFWTWIVSLHVTMILIRVQNICLFITFLDWFGCFSSLKKKFIFNLFGELVQCILINLICSKNWIYICFSSCESGYYLEVRYRRYSTLWGISNFGLAKTTSEIVFLSSTLYRSIISDISAQGKFWNLYGNS